MAKIVGIGANVFDTLFNIGTYPKEDTKTRATAMKTAGGGPVATGLVAAQKLGGDTAYIGNLSDDNAGKFLKEDFEKYGVKTDLIDVKSGYRTFSSVLWLCADTATRTCVFDKGNLPALELNDEQKEAIKEAIYMANKRDIIVLAGKGHEPYQEINHKTYPFDERIIVKEIIKEMESK